MRAFLRKYRRDQKNARDHLKSMGFPILTQVCGRFPVFQHPGIEPTTMKITTTLSKLAALLVLPLSLAFVSAEDNDKPKPERPPGGPGGPGSPGGRMQMPPFEEIDTDKSGDISEKEFAEFQAKRVKEMFGRIDENKDGKLTKEEMAKMMQGRGRPGQGGPGQGGPGGRPEGAPKKPEGAPKKPE